MVKGKETCYLFRNCQPPLRCVPPFSIESLQENTFVVPPKKIDVYRQKQCCSMFRKYFLRGDIPCGKLFDKSKSRNGSFLQWKVPPEELDLSYYLPLFFEGLCETLSPYRELAIYGVSDLLRAGDPDKILNCVPQLILPVKKALNTKNPCCLVATMRALQQLVMSGACVGQALVPYFRQILPIFNLFRNKNICIGDQIDFNRHGQIGDVVDQTLQTLECHGGPDAYINIKYMVPTYESCVMN